VQEIYPYLETKREKKEKW